MRRGEVGLIVSSFVDSLKKRRSPAETCDQPAPGYATTTATDFSRIGSLRSTSTLKPGSYPRTLEGRSNARESTRESSL